MLCVCAIRKRYNSKTGRVAITFEVERETWTNMNRSADRYGHYGTLDYITGTINAAFLVDTGSWAKAARRREAEHAHEAATIGPKEDRLLYFPKVPGKGRGEPS